MSLVELFLIAVGLSMDAFAVAVCKGLGMSRLNMSQALVIALFFGGFQAIMPILGWLLGAQFATFVAPVAHWIAFGLLAFIGGKMLLDAWRDDGEEDDDVVSIDAPLDMRELFMLATATSIDALMVGITFAFLSTNIVWAAGFIGVVTFLLSLAGVAIGHQFGARWERPSAIAGGVVLIFIGFKVLVEHLGLF